MVKQAKGQSPETASVTFAGSGGAGVMTAGQMLLDAAAKSDMYGFMTRSMGPQIRGGEAAAFIRLSPREIVSVGNWFDVLVAFDWVSTERFKAEINLEERSLVLFDPEQGDAPDWIKESGARIEHLPFAEVSAGIEGARPNMVALGVCAALFGLPEVSVLSTVEKALGKKGPGVLKASSDAVKAGYVFGSGLESRCRLGRARIYVKTVQKSRWNISGNEACGLGALRGGVRFVAAYPITPATEILEWLAPNLEKVGGHLVQAEDELASINMAIGGSFGGVPSLTATSGPGLSLMTESIGLSVASETPVVIIDVQRGGPSTGIPTKSEQVDLNIALYGLHGDAPHLVTATNSVADCLFTSQWSVYLAEKLQTPVIVLTDQMLGQTRCIIDQPADSAFRAERLVAEPNTENYLRYKVTASGVSPMAIPGTPGGEYVADGLEHNPKGTPSSQAEHHLEQLEKRERKLMAFNFGKHWADVEGEGEVAIVTWGSSTGPSREAIRHARRAGLDVRLVSIRLLAPVQIERFRQAIDGVKKVLVVEQSHSQQFYHYLFAHFDLPDDVNVYSQPGPLPIRPAKVFEELMKWS